MKSQKKWMWEQAHNWLHSQVNHFDGVIRSANTAFLFDAFKRSFMFWMIALRVSSEGRHIGGITDQVNNRVTTSCSSQVPCERPLTNTPIPNRAHAILFHARKVTGRAPVGLTSNSAEVGLHLYTDMMGASISRTNICASTVSSESCHCHTGLRATAQCIAHNTLGFLALNHPNP
jgi:hypothetical protein